MADGSTRVFVSGALLFAAAPAVAYGYVLARNSAYFAVLGIPPEFIEVDGNTVLRFGAVFALLLAFFLAMVNAIPATARGLWLGAGKARGRSRLAATSRVVFALAAVFSVASSVGWLMRDSGGRFVLVGAVVYGVVGLLYSWSTFQSRLRFVRQRRQRFAAAGSRTFAFRQRALWAFRIGISDRRLPVVASLQVGVATVLVLGFAGSSVTGYIEGFRTEWLVLNAKPERVLLLRSGDDFLTVTFDRRTHRIRNEYSLTRFDKSSSYVFSAQHLGRLSAAARP
jgi:hypothetical protein